MHGLSIVALASLAGQSQKPALPLPPIEGFSIVQTLVTGTGDRESFHSVETVTPKGVRWAWRLVEVSAEGDTLHQKFHYAELSADLADAIRFRGFHDRHAPEEHPGYTMHALSRAVYRRLVATGSDTFQVMALDIPRGGGLAAAVGMGRSSPRPVRWSGRLTVASRAPVAFPLLVDGERVQVPALHLRGRLTARGGRWEPELWVLADSTYPLLLKWVGAPTEPENVLQTIRVDLPHRGTGPREGSGSGGLGGHLERGLSTACRAELPGVYFAFNSAVLDAASDRTLGVVAGILTKHPDWIVTLEGHTDSIGSAASNRLLSERRVQAVRDRLVKAHRIDSARLRTAGYGSGRPRETNTTIEGRARNRRVELVRDC